MTESWLNPLTTNAMLHIDNYRIENDLRADRTDTAEGRGGGLLVFVRNDVTVSKIECDSNFNQYIKFYVSTITVK